MGNSDNVNNQNISSPSNTSHLSKSAKQRLKKKLKREKEKASAAGGASAFFANNSPKNNDKQSTITSVTNEEQQQPNEQQRHSIISDSSSCFPSAIDNDLDATVLQEEACDTRVCEAKEFQEDFRGDIIVESQEDKRNSSKEGTSFSNHLSEKTDDKQQQQSESKKLD